MRITFSENKTIEEQYREMVQKSKFYWAEWEWQKTRDNVVIDPCDEYNFRFLFIMRKLSYEAAVHWLAKEENRSIPALVPLCLLEDNRQCDMTCGWCGGGCLLESSEADRRAWEEILKYYEVVIGDDI